MVKQPDTGPTPARRKPQWPTKTVEELRAAGRLGGLASAAKRRGDGVSLTAMRQQTVSQMAALLVKTASAIAKLPPDRATDHRALAATLIALSQRIDEAIAAQGGDLAGESYEARLARAYTSQGLAPPGRIVASPD